MIWTFHILIYLNFIIFIALIKSSLLTFINVSMLLVGLKTNCKGTFSCKQLERLGDEATCLAMKSSVFS